ncbi:putative VQ motif-containing protein/18/20/21/25 [Helianthus annuus]|uniref:VQ motif-containing protein 8, chloroplastic-like n=1 Tax=Helianthus annuus TaxID=4232 RepID=UPI000B9024EC|nr:VQ motif-containing protein 8, chloroplastic-like [Helianthus annuus]KAJ0896519.1 putative VQ motif-containing protein/18/20/21/25 [Helianthus annuus]
MTSSKFYDGDHKQQLKSRIVINGPRPSPLNIKQESHTIHKHHNHHHENHQQKQIRKPVIIYIHSPEIIHTKPHEFMALVQKLTGCSSSNDQQQQQKKKNNKMKNKTLKQDGYDLNVNQLFNNSGITHKIDESMKSKSPMFKTPSNPYVADVPLFTPNTSDHFFSPHRFLSPGSILEIIKELPEY